jgi:hypothetical protein
MSPDAAYKAVTKQTHERLFILLSDSDFSNAEGQQHPATALFLELVNQVLN